jgi:hypothetical protein
MKVISIKQGTFKQRTSVQRPVKETAMNASLKQEKLNRYWFSPVAEFLIERLLLGLVAALFVYGGYRMFLL